MGRRVAVGGRQALQALRPALRAWEQIGIFPLRPTALTGTLGSGAARDLDLPPHPPPSPPTESVLCRALPGLIKQGNEQLGWGDESPGWLEAGTVYDGRLQLVTLGEVSSHNPGGAACRSLSKPRECWVLEGGLAGVLGARVWVSSWSKLRLRPWLPPRLGRPWRPPRVTPFCLMLWQSQGRLPKTMGSQ